MKEAVIKNEEWKILVPNWHGPLGLAHIDAWVQASCAKKVRYDDLKSECWNSVGSGESKWLSFKGCLSYLGWAMHGFDRKYRSSSGFIIGHHVVEFRIRKSSDGRFRGWSLSVLQTYVDYFKFSILAKRKMSADRYKVHLVCDEAYQPGMLAQVSQSLGIPTLKLRQWGEQLTIWPFNSHILFGGPDFHGVCLTAVFEEEEIQRVQRNLLARIEGDYSSLRYMSAVKGNNGVQLKGVDNDRTFVIYLHDFLDSPGVYGETLFHDQWDWIHFAEREVSKVGGHLLLKLHSNQNQFTKGPNDSLIEKFGGKSNVSFIDRKASLKQVVSTHRPRAVLTMYGSVLMECACLDIPVIYTSHNPYVAFNFGYRASSKKAFASAIVKYANCPVTEFDKDQMERRARLVAVAQLRIHKLMIDSSLGIIPLIDVSPSVMKELGFDLKEGSNVYERIALHGWKTNWYDEHHRLHEYVKEKIAESRTYQAAMAHFGDHT